MLPFLELLVETIAIYTIYFLEVVGVFIIAYSCIRGFLTYIRHRLKFNDTSIKIEIAKGLALGLEFKLGGEILRTILVRTLDEIKILAAIILLRIILTYLIHWEIKAEIQLEEELLGCHLYQKKDQKNSEEDPKDPE